MDNNIVQLSLAHSISVAKICGAKHLLLGFRIDDEILKEIKGIEWDHFKHRLPLWGEIEQTIIFWE